MTPTPGQLANISLEQLLRVIKELGPDAKLEPIKNKLNNGKRKNIDVFYTCADVDQARMKALNGDYVVMQGLNHVLTRKGSKFIGVPFGQVKSPEEPAFA